MKTTKALKSLLASALALALAASLFVTALAAEDACRAAGQYDVSIDGETIDAPAVVMVPARKVGEALGFEVTWLGNGQFTMDNGAMHTTVTLGEDRYFVTTSIEGAVGMSAPFSLGVPPYCVDGVSYVPLGLFEALKGNAEDMFEIKDGAVSINTTVDADSVQIPNPFVDYETLAEAEKAAGFSFTVPDSVDGYSERTIQVMSGKMIQVIYWNGDDRLFLRKQAGEGDISGDYNSYAEVETAEIDGRTVTLKGDGGKISVALWEDGGYTYAVTADTPMDGAAMRALVAEIR